MSYFVSEKFPNDVSLIHIPKTGGSTLVELFKDRQGYFNIGHRSAYMIMKGIDKPPNSPQNYSELFNKSHKISVVRNPYERIRSWFYFMKKYEAFIHKYVKNGFHQFLLDIDAGLNPEVAAWTQTKYLYVNEKLAVDQIISFEKLKEEFEKTFEEELIGHKWKTNSANYEIEEKSKELIRKIYKEDFVNFKYEE
jgi:hypothetical protein